MKMMKYKSNIFLCSLYHYSAPCKVIFPLSCICIYLFITCIAYCNHGLTEDLKDRKDLMIEEIKHLGPLAATWILDWYNYGFETHRIPKMWKKTKVVALLKPGKSPLNPKSYKPVSPLCHLYKLFDRLFSTI